MKYILFLKFYWVFVLLESVKEDVFEKFGRFWSNCLCCVTYITYRRLGLVIHSFLHDFISIHWNGATYYMIFALFSLVELVQFMVKRILYLSCSFNEPYVILKIFFRKEELASLAHDIDVCLVRLMYWL